jgi:hypothetical protein
MFKITRSKFRILSQIFANLSPIFLGSVILPAFSRNFDLNQLAVLILGTIGTIISIQMAMYCAEKGKL